MRNTTSNKLASSSTRSRRRLQHMCRNNSRQFIRNMRL